ncbi:hypothetical protein ACFLRC_04615, partial [Candidatus Altiarchaeota archaeon]
MKLMQEFFSKPIDITFYCYLVILLCFLWIFHYPSISSTDEFAYLLSIQSLATEGYLDVWNGQDEYGNFSWEYVPDGMLPVEVSDGFVIVGYAPILYNFIAAPFFFIGGREGVHFLSMVSFVLTTFLIYLLVNFFFHSRHLAFLSAFSFSTMTFALDWAVSTIPHSISTLLVFASFSLTLLDHKCGGGVHRGLWLFL